MEKRMLIARSWEKQERIQLSNRGQKREGSVCFQVPPYCVPGPIGHFS